jgi:hypothetical protein
MLLKNTQFSIEEAAKELGCAEGDIRYYLSQDKLRCAIDASHIKHDLIVSLFELYSNEELAQRMCSLSPSRMSDWEEFQLSEKDLVHVNTSRVTPNFLYFFSNGFIRQANRKDGIRQPWTCVLADFNYHPVYLLSRCSDKSYKCVRVNLGEIKADDYGINTLEPIAITGEELDRFVQGGSTTRKPLLSSTFTPPPERDNDAARTVCRYGNELAVQLKKVPDYMEIIEYIVKRGHPDFPISYSKGDLRIGDTVISKKDLKARLKRYRDN